jgi:flagellar biosynthesis protein FlhF
MVIKKFQASSESEAMMQVKEEMGSDAVIMNIKKTKHKGVMKLFKPTMVEVTAALEEANDAPIVPKKQENVNLVADEPVKFAVETEAKPPVQEAPKTQVQIPQNVAAKNETAIEAKLDNLQNLLEKQMGKEVVNETEEMEEKDENMKFLQLIYNTLLDNEVQEKYANQIIDEISASGKENVSVDTLLANVYQKMILKFGEPAPVKENKKGTKIIFFIGPTGVGKTTTVAKIASKLKLEQKKKIALLTTDTYRIAATEQLHTYAEILDVPFQVIYTPEELKETKEEWKDYDIILADTAGHSPSNQEQHDDLKHFIDSVDDAEKDLYLVVSATTKYRDLLKIVDSYKDLKQVKIIFTKLDETTTFGNILNVRMYTNAKLSYITSGQNVPDDISLLDAQKIVRKLLGGH